MTDFAEMARQAKLKHDQAVDDKERQRVEKEQAEEARLSNARSALFLEVQPTLERARVAFEEQGIQAVFETVESYEVTTRGLGKKVWAINFKCCVSKKTSTVGFARALCGKTVRFVHDGEKLTIKEEGNAFGSATYQSADKAVEYALSSLYQAQRDD